MRDSWIREGTEWLMSLQNRDAGWGYYPGGASSVEPTVLSGLALLATHGRQLHKASKDVANQAAKWLAKLQHPEGWLGVTQESSEATWPTPYAILLWSSLQGFEDESERAVAWLLKHKGRTFNEPGIVGHDGTLEGWSWIAGTHSWLEPTALAVMALRRTNHLHHPRTRQGIELILDRVIEGGGWNYGNTSVFGRTLRPQPAPTGLALLALANMEINRDTVTASCSYLGKALQKIRSPVSLSWGILGLTAWNDRPEEAMKWLEESSNTVHKSESQPCLLPVYFLRQVRIPTGY